MNNLEAFLSQKRLSKYGKLDKSQALKYYLYNMELSEAFYPSICFFEIALRNKINSVFIKHFGKNWLLSDSIAFNTSHQADIQKALRQLEKERKTIQHDYIISELNFGFWTRLFTHAYSNILWNDITLLSEIFNNTKRISLSKKGYELNQIRHYRNRIFHYSSIIYTGLPLSPKQLHDYIYANLKALGATSILNELRNIDRFELVYNRGLESGILVRKEFKK